MRNHTYTLAAVPRPFGEFRLIAQAGRGGMGEVWKAEDTAGNLIAIKFPRKGESVSQEQARRLKDEGRILADLDHRGICRVFGNGAFDGLPYLAMEYLEGGSLQQLMESTNSSPADRHFATQPTRLLSVGVLLDRLRMSGDILPVGPLDPQAVLRRYNVFSPDKTLLVGIALCRALGHAHHRGIVHGDIKPGNIILTRDGDPVLTDFGAAMQFHGAHAPWAYEGSVYGTIEYMAPELAHSAGHADHRVDLYGVGAVLYQMVSGQKHFYASGDTQGDLLRLRRHQPAPPGNTNGTLDPGLWEILLKALSNQPGDRFYCARDFEVELARYYRGQYPRSQTHRKKKVG